MINRKSHARFRLVPKSTTLDDLEGLLRIVSKHMRLSEPTTKIWMKIDPRYRRQRCSPMTLDSGKIRFMRIFAGLRSLERGVKQQWGNWKRGFSGFRTLRLRHLRKWGQHYLSPFHWPENTWAWMTLSGLNGHFTLNFHYYKLALSNYLLLI